MAARWAGGSVARSDAQAALSSRRERGSTAGSVRGIERQLDGSNPPDPHPVATHVQDDGRQPRPQPDLPDPLRGVPPKRPICPDERVLGSLLSVAPVTDHPQGDREEPPGVCVDERLEPAVEIGGKAVGQGGVVGAIGLVHQPMKHHAVAFGCIRR